MLVARWGSSNSRRDAGAPPGPRISFGAVPPEPRASYRLQLSPALGFREAAALVPYLAELGVSHLYLSPCFEARAGSSHGYDVVDFRRVRGELGGEPGLQALFEASRRHGIGILLDVVPNHMAVAGRENPWWWDVLENGRASAYADFFDLDWSSASADDGLILPVLGDHSGRVLEAGEIRVQREDSRFVVRYGDHAFPVAPDSLAAILAPAADACHSELLAFVARGLAHLPAASAAEGSQRQQRQRDLSVLKRLLGQALAQESSAAAAVDAELTRLCADVDRLDGLLAKQPYRLAWWRIAMQEISYRRFFDIDQLVALRMEDPSVFAPAHELVLRWLDAGAIQGIRIDHVDGLRDPEAYLRRLRRARPQAWIVVEKILETGEELPAGWPVDGTTGYDFLGLVGGLFVDPAAEAPLTELYAAFTGERRSYRDVCIETKRLVLTRLFGGDLRRLTALFVEVCRHHRRQRDYAADELELALSEVIAHFSVYRSYARPGSAPSEHDTRRVEQAVAAAGRALHDAVPADLLAFLRDLLLLRIPGEVEQELALRFQQLTGPAMAKGVEDTAFYVYNRFVALNEVGGDPGRFAVSPDELHRHCANALARAPRGLLATSTHDTKRSEDVRARLALLSEMPRDWAAAVRRWSAHNERHRRGDGPDRNDEYLLYQILVGAWPLEVPRAVAFMEKAIRESKRHTSWRRPDAAYERAVRRFVEDALGDETFRSELRELVDPLVAPGRVNSLSQTLLKLVAPGVPDLYQGSELWDLSLVDPDNRRPVDFAARSRLLAEVAKASHEVVAARSQEGAPKLWLIRRALELRARRPELFGPEGSYAPLRARGRRREHVVAVCRGGGAVALVPRLVLGLAGAWQDTSVELPGGGWRSCLTGETLAGGAHGVGDLLAHFPVALLEREARA